MKKIFIQIKEWILKHRRGLIYGVLASFVFGFCFFNWGGIWVENVVFADDQWGLQTQTSVATEKITEWEASFSFLRKVIYILLYPLLLLAWKLVDNSLVYWEVFWFDAVLWQLWNFVKNLANFALWFFFLYKIFKYLINNKENIKETLIWALVAWVWIQASWFIMAALIDVSTILAYGVWWLPISVLGEKEYKDEMDKEYRRDSWNYNPAIFKNMVYVNAEDLDTIHIYLTSTYTWKDILISDCDTIYYESSGAKDNLIVAPKMIYYTISGQDTVSDANRCHYRGQVFYFNSLYKNQSGDLAQFVNGGKFDCWSDGCENRQKEYNEELTKIRWNIKGATSGESLSWLVSLIEQGQILQIRDAHTWWVGGSLWNGVYAPGDKWWLDKNNEWTRNDGTTSWWATSRLQDLLKGKAYVGVFTTLYSSLMHSWEGILPSGNTGWTFVKLLNTFLTFWYLVAIWIPLIVVAVVFMIRICILRMAIILSPFIVLISAFKEIWDKVKGWKFLEYFRLENLIPIIFSPALICFAVSMSTVLVTVITKMNDDKIASEGSTILWWLIEINLWGMGTSLASLVISAFGVAITWFIVRAAVEASKIWEMEIVKKLKWLASDALWTIPIVPIPWKDGKWVDWVWANTAFGLNNHESVLDKVTGEIKSKYDTKSNTAIDQWLHPEKAEADAKEAQNAAKEAQDKQIGTDFLTAIQAQQINGDWTQIPIEVTIDGAKERRKFNDLSNVSKKAVIDGINTIKDINQRQKFKTSGEIQIWNDKYKFNNETSKYEIDQTSQTPQTTQP